MPSYQDYAKVYGFDNPSLSKGVIASIIQGVHVDDKANSVLVERFHNLKPEAQREIIIAIEKTVGSDRYPEKDDVFNNPALKNTPAIESRKR